MEIKSLMNINTTFRKFRVLTICFCCLCLIITMYSVYMSYSFAEKQREKIYVLENGKSLMVALSQDTKANRPVEAKEHIRRFHEFLFTLAPDPKAIMSNIDRALYLSDRSAYNFYKDLEEKGYYKRIVSANMYQRYDLENIELNTDIYPYKATIYGKIFIIRESNITIRNLISTCDLINTVRSENNPQGFMIEKFEIKEQNDIKTEQR